MRRLNYNTVKLFSRYNREESSSAPRKEVARKHQIPLRKPRMKYQNNPRDIITSLIFMYARVSQRC
jgi:hypothetical protein